MMHRDIVRNPVRLGLIVLVLAVGAAVCPADKPRVIVLTDISNEPDDEQSLVRFLVYANEFEVEGLIATTSVWLKDKVRPDKIGERIGALSLIHI